uniref:Uncharacterized protein n=1 Tax=Glossina palpalis gambiensis TaxID=67801 RepID=A0A1B0BZX1_9MUSC
MLKHDFAGVGKDLDSPANWQDYSQPMIGHSSLTVFGNLALRLTGVLMTFCIFLLLFCKNKAIVNSVSLFTKILDELILLDINVAKVLNQVYYLSLAFTFSWAILLVFTAWHSIYFYQYITLKKPEIKYYLVVTLTNFYKSMFMYYMVVELFSLYMMSKELNKFLNDLQENYQRDNERERARKYACARTTSSRKPLHYAKLRHTKTVMKPQFADYIVHVILDCWDDFSSVLRSKQSATPSPRLYYGL